MLNIPYPRKDSNRMMPKINPSGEHRMQLGNIQTTDMSEQDILDAQTFLDRTELEYNQDHINRLARILYNKRLAGMKQGVEMINQEGQSQLSVYRKAITAVCNIVLTRIVK